MLRIDGQGSMRRGTKSELRAGSWNALRVCSFRGGLSKNIFGIVRPTTKQPWSLVLQRSRSTTVQAPDAWNTWKASLVSQFNWTRTRGSSACPHRHVIKCPSNILSGSNAGRGAVRGASGCSTAGSRSRAGYPPRSRPRHPGPVPGGQGISCILFFWSLGILSFQLPDSRTKQTTQAEMDFSATIDPATGQPLPPDAIVRILREPPDRSVQHPIHHPTPIINKLEGKT